MQFVPDMEGCFRNKWEIRKISEPRRSEILLQIKHCRFAWHSIRSGLDGFDKSKKWMEKRGEKERRIVMQEKGVGKDNEI